MNFKKFTAAALSVLVLGGTLPAVQLAAPVMTSFAEEAEYTEVTEGVLTYHVYSDHAVVAKCDDTVEGGVNISAEVNGVPVTEIYLYSFSSCYSLDSVTIPDSVTTISVCAFIDCTNLTSIEIPESVNCISWGAFYGCTALTSIAIPAAVETIGEYAFCECSSLSLVTIPNTVTTISEGAFSNCTSLTSITIPNSVTTIGKKAFSKCTSLTLITIPDSVTSIEESVFSRCTSLASITIPNSIITIGEAAFEYCYNLSSIIIPDSVTSIGEAAFYECSSLSEFVIPDSVTIISDFALYKCTSLSSITIPDSITTVGNDAFRGCSSLTSITIPVSVKSIGYWTFSGCTALDSVVIQNPDCELGQYLFYSVNPDVVMKDIVIKGYAGSTAQAYAEENGYKFESLGEAPGKITYGEVVKDSMTFHVFKDHAELVHCDEEATDQCFIPDKVEGVPVTVIGATAFYNCQKLGYVNIPETVEVIGDSAFQSCTEIDTITLPYSVRNIGNYVFYNCQNLRSVTFLNPETEFFVYSGDVINNGYDENDEPFYTGVIQGYEGSTANVYADENGYTFQNFEPCPVNFTYGDVNNDSEVNLNDAVAILQYIALSAKYPIEGDALEAADVCDNGTSGINGNDALAIMMVDAKLLSADKLPVTSDVLK